MSKPFQDYTFCCTGIATPQRLCLVDKIAALGGIFLSDLMSLVQFLVVGERNTEKYWYSVRWRYDICFVGPSVIEDIYSRWKAGEPVLFNRTLHSLPVFHGCSVCLARIDRPSEEETRLLMSERFRIPPAKALPKVMPKDPFLVEEVTKVLSQLGATVGNTLTPARTVVVATSASGIRHTIAKQWGIPVVHPLWIYDSCLREASLHLEDYEITDKFNPYNNGSFVWKNLFVWRLSPFLPLEKRRNRSSSKKKTEIWTSIMDSAHPLLTKEVHSDTWDDNVLSDNEPKELYTADETTRQLPQEEASSSLFSGLCFLPVGLTIPEQNVLRTVVESHKGKIVTSSEDSQITHVVMLVKNGPQTQLMLLMLPSSIKRQINKKSISVVSNWFIERSIFYGRLCDDCWAPPMLGIVPLRAKCQVSITGFTGVELLHLEKLVTYLNLEFCDTLNSTRDLLIVNINLFKNSFRKNSPQLLEYRFKEILDCPVYSSGRNFKSVAMLSSKNKMAAARKWGIPVVSLAFLWEMIAILEGQPNLMMPEISDLHWCIFAPKSGSCQSKFMDVSFSKVSSVDNSMNNEPGVSDNNIKLPSPKKSKDREKYGRLVGRGESLLKKLEAERDRTEEEGREPSSETPSSQDILMVGYGNVEKAEKHKILLEKLEGTEGRLKRSRGAA